MANGRIHRVGLAVSLPTKVAKLLHFQADVQASSEGVREKVASRFGPGFRQNYVISDPSKIPRRYIYIYIYIYLESSFQLHPSLEGVWLVCLVAVTMVGLGQDESNCLACRLSWRKSRGWWPERVPLCNLKMGLRL